MAENFHVGNKIKELLEVQHKTRRELGAKLGMSEGNARYLLSRASLDVRMLQKIGNALKYNFFQHFPIDDGNRTQAADLNHEKKLNHEKDKSLEEMKQRMEELQGKTGGQEKLLNELKRETELLKQENGYLKEINELLKKKD